MKTFQWVPGWDHSRFTESMMSDLTPSFGQEAATMPIQSVTNSQWKISAPSITAYNPKVSYVKMKSNIDYPINTTGLFYHQNVVFEMTLICHNKEILKEIPSTDPGFGNLSKTVYQVIEIQIIQGFGSRYYVDMNSLWPSQRIKEEKIS